MQQLSKQLKNTLKTKQQEEREVTNGFNPLIKNRRSPWMTATTAALIAVSAAGWSAPANAQANKATELSVAEIEKVFWVCDHAATIGRIDGSTAITCSGLSEALKLRKFGGDFNAMLVWWRQHKEAEHLALAKANGTSAPPLAQITP